MATEKVAKQGTNPEAFVGDTSPLVAYFESFIDDIYLPFLNSIYPYETVTNPFDVAFSEYLKADLQSFEEKLASLAKNSNEKPFDFVNASYEELLETPVDSAAENLNAVSQDKSSGEVTSQDRDLSHSDSPSAVSSGITNPFVVSNSIFDASSSSLSLGGSLTVSGTNYLANISQGTFQSSSNFSVNVAQPQQQAFALRVSVDAFAIRDLADIIGVAKAKHLLDGVSKGRGSSVILDGVSGNAEGPFLLKDIIDNKPNLILGNAEFLSIGKDGGFSFVARNALPQAEHFFFRVNELDDAGNIIDQKVAQAYVSEIKDQAYILNYEDGVFSAQGNVTLTGNTGLLADGAAAGDAVLSVILINPTLNSMDPLADTYEIVPPTNVFNEYTNFNFADTSLNVRSDGSFTFSTTADIPLVLNFVVSDGLGQMALASATFSPAELKPVVLDLNGNGIELVSAAQSTVTLGDLTRSNNNSPVGWVGEGDGILMYDPKGTGELSALNQISFVSYLPGAHTDLEGLSAFDSNFNGSLDSSDDKFALFSVLFADGSSQALAELGIVSLSLTSDHQESHLNGNTVFGQTTFQTADGQSHVAADVALSVGIALTQEAAHINEQISKANCEQLA